MGLFVIQKHNAKNLHYDFRIEINNILKSWAIPKGPSTNPKTKRLAILTEDHSIEYADFEGVIDKGYGLGQVLLWDKGSFTNITENNGNKIPLDEAFENGLITINLKGEKLKGNYALIKTKKNWLLTKMNDDKASTKNILKERPESILSGKLIDEIE